MKNILFTFLFSVFSMTMAFAQSSPYVETSDPNINNTKFKASSLRVTTLTRPVPFHNESSTINATISPRFTVAKFDVTFLILVTTSTWAAANGWTLNVDIGGIIDVGVALTGCQSYTETLLGGGWRVPTQRELITMYLTRKELEKISGFSAFNNTDNYWSSTQNGTTSAWALNMGTGRNFVADRGSSYRVRCVKDL